jgi:hypothetical protein
LDQGVFSTTQVSTPVSSRPPSSAHYDNAASDAESSSRNPQIEMAAFDSTCLDSTSSSASNISSSSLENLLFSRDVKTTSRRELTSIKRASLGSIDALRDQGNIKYLIDFILLFIREDFKLNASNLFATRCVLILITFYQPLNRRL